MKTPSEPLETPLDLRKTNNALGRKSLKGFVEVTKDDYEFNWHHEELCKIAERFVTGDLNRLMVFMPPQHGKSEIVSRRLPAYALGKNPKLRIACVSYAHSLAAKFNRDVQRIIDTPEYEGIFPGTRLSSRNVRASAQGSWLRNADEFEIIGHGGGYLSVGVGGGLTGNKVDIAIIDDPVKDAQEAYSERYRDKVWEWYESVLKTRLHNDSKILLVMTRWHEDDLAGRILERETGWEVMKLKAISTEDSDNRKAGEALWPNRHALDTLRKTEETSPRVFNSLYQQEPAPSKGNLINIDSFGRFLINQLDNPVWNYIVDPAYTEKEMNDPSGVIAYAYIDSTFYVRAAQSVRMEFPELMKFLPDFCKRYGYDNRSRIRVEPKASGKSLVQTMRETGLNIMEAKAPKMDKVARLTPCLPTIDSGRVKLLGGENWEYLLNECALFPNGKHDDLVDCLTMMIDAEGQGQEWVLI